MKKSIRDLINSWISKADWDLKTAESLIDILDLVEIACFHSQQSCEKYFKAYLIFKGIDFPKLHQLETLIDIVSEKDKNILEYRERCTKLSPFAVESKYPEHSSIPKEDALFVIQTAKDVRKYVTSKI